jgi:hypothetical protein
MPVTFEPEFWWDPVTQTVKFYARFEGRRIHCAVSRPALEDVSRICGLVPEDMEYAFREHRQQIEAKAMEKMHAGRFEDEDKIHVKAADLRRSRNGPEARLNIRRPVPDA